MCYKIKLTTTIKTFTKYNDTSRVAAKQTNRLRDTETGNQNPHNHIEKNETQGVDYPYENDSKDAEMKVNVILKFMPQVDEIERK